MYTNSDMKELCKMEYSSTYKEVSECAKSIIKGMRNVSKYGIIVEDNEIINAGTPDEYKEIKISVPKKSFIVVDDKEMSGMELAKWYKDNLSEFVKLAIMISDITSGNNLLEDSGLSEEEIKELLSGLYRVKAKVRDDEWTKELSDACLKAFDEEIQGIIEKVKKEEEEYIEV